MTTDSEATPKTELRTVISWDEWKAQWSRATDLPARMGLLHSGFKVEIRQDQPKYVTDFAELLCLYFEEAGKLLEFPSRDRNPLPAKALGVLARSFFKEYSIESILWLSPDAFNSVLDFFGTRIHTAKDESDRRWLEFASPILRSGLVAQPVREIVNDFAKELALALWKGIEGSRLFNQETVELFRQKRLVSLEILTVLERLNASTLVRSDFPEEWKRFDAAALAKLKELALIEGKTVEAALIKGSAAAKLYILTPVALKEFERQERAVAAERMIAEGQRTLQSLHS